GVVIGAATSAEVGAGVKPLADILDPRVPFLLHETRPGESPASVAAQYEISVQTLLENNPVAEETRLVGQQLVVPRQEGILYKITHGETVDSIVSQYDNVTAGIVIEYRPNAITDPDN